MAKNAINTFSQPTDPSATVVCKDLLESPDIEHNDSLRDIQSIRAGEPIVIKADANEAPTQDSMEMEQDFASNRMSMTHENTLFRRCWTASS